MYSIKTDSSPSRGSWDDVGNTGVKIFCSSVYDGQLNDHVVLLFRKLDENSYIVFDLFTNDTNSHSEQTLLTNNEIEKKGIKLAIKRAEEADLKIIVVDPKNLDFKGFLEDFLDENAIFLKGAGVNLDYEN